MLEIRSIHKTFGSQTALERIDLKIQEGEFFSLLGPSGCGKSTLLRILAGLDEATSGEILWKGKRIDQLPARERPFNMVFQKYALFPHLSVSDNVAFGLRLKKVDEREVRERVEEALALVNLGGFESRFPETLSGGQQQRVALARALVNRPACVLLDEPLGALDQKLREKMQADLRLLQKRLGLTFIFVTHDQEEAMILSDRVAVMNAGRLEQVSTPRELFEKPESLFSARFVGGRNEVFGPCATAITGLEPKGSKSVGHSLRAFIRPEQVRVMNEASSGATNRLSGEVFQILFRGLRSEVAVRTTGGIIIRSLVEPSQASGFQVGQVVTVEFPIDETHLFWAGE